MTRKIPLFAVTAAAIALVLSGCEDLTGTDDMPTALPHIGTWYFADPDPDDDIPVPPGARLVLGETEFTLAMGDDTGTMFTLFQTPGVTKFEVTGTYMIGVDGNASFSLPDDLGSAVTVKPDELTSEIAPEVVTAAAALSADASAKVVFDPVNPNRVTISGSFLPGLLSLPNVTEVTACKGAPCMPS